MVIPVGMEEFLNRKYAILQQQADATTEQAAATTRNAATSALAGAAAARLDNTRSDLMPAESRANIAKSGAETGYLQTQTRWFGPEARARIGNLDANAFATRIGGLVAKKEGLDEIGTLPSSMDTIRGMRARLPSMGDELTPSRRFIP